MQVEAGLVVKLDVAMGDNTTGDVVKQDVKARSQKETLQQEASQNKISWGGGIREVAK